MAEYTVLLQAQPDKYYRRVPVKISKSLEVCFKYLEQNPKFHISRIRKLQGYGLYRYKVGNLRVVYEINEIRKEVSVEAILPRGDVYKRLGG